MNCLSDISMNYLWFLILFIISSLFAHGMTKVIPLLPLGSLKKKKPFSCVICSTFWSFLICTALLITVGKLNNVIIFNSIYFLILAISSIGILDLLKRNDINMNILDEYDLNTIEIVKQILASHSTHIKNMPSINFFNSAHYTELKLKYGDIVDIICDELDLT